MVQGVYWVLFEAQGIFIFAPIPSYMSLEIQGTPPGASTRQSWKWIVTYRIDFCATEQVFIPYRIILHIDIKSYLVTEKLCMGTRRHRFHGVFSIKSSVLLVKSWHIKNNFCFVWWQAQHNHNNDRNEK